MTLQKRKVFITDRVEELCQELFNVEPDNFVSQLEQFVAVRVGYKPDNKCGFLVYEPVSNQFAFVILDEQTHTLLNVLDFKSGYKLGWLRKAIPWASKAVIAKLNKVLKNLNESRPTEPQLDIPKIISHHFPIEFRDTYHGSSTMAFLKEDGTPFRCTVPTHFPTASFKTSETGEITLEPTEELLQLFLQKVTEYVTKRDIKVLVVNWCEIDVSPYGKLSHPALDEFIANAKITCVPQRQYDAEDGVYKSTPPVAV